MAAPKILYLVVGAGGASAVGGGGSRECKPCSLQGKSLHGQGADPRGWEGSVCRNTQLPSGHCPSCGASAASGSSRMFAPGKTTGNASEGADPGLGVVLAGRDTSGGLAGGSLLPFGVFSLTNPASKNCHTESGTGVGSRIR